MINAALLNYVQQQLAARYTPEQIREALVSAGYPMREVEEVLDYATKPRRIQEAQQRPIEQILKKEGKVAEKEIARYGMATLLRMWFLSLSMPTDIFREAKKMRSFAGAFMNIAAPAVLGGLVAGSVLLIKFLLKIETSYAGINIFGIGGLFTKVGTIERLFITPIEAILVWLSITTVIYLFGAFIGGDGDFETFAYFTSIAYAPVVLFVGFLQLIVPACIVFFTYVAFGVLGIYPTFVAIKETHDISTAKAIAALAIPLGIVAALLLPVILDFTTLFKTICA